MESKSILILSHITLWALHITISPTAILAQCEKPPIDYLNMEFSTSPPSDSMFLSPQKPPSFDPPLFCVYPPIASPPPPPPPPPHRYGPGPISPEHKRPKFSVWCVAKPTVPGPVMQRALDYACGSGADCRAVQPNGPCFQPNTILAHASYAFNSYFQSAKLAGGTCDFGGTAMLVTDDPSFDGCIFLNT